MLSASLTTQSYISLRNSSEIHPVTCQLHQYDRGGDVDAVVGVEHLPYVHPADRLVLLVCQICGVDTGIQGHWVVDDVIGRVDVVFRAFEEPLVLQFVTFFNSGYDGQLNKDSFRNFLDDTWSIDDSYRCYKHNFKNLL